MRKLIVFAAACLIACSFLLTVQPASAATAYSGAWEPTDLNTNTFTIDYTFGVINFGIYEIGTNNHIDLEDGIGGVVTKISFESGEVFLDDIAQGIFFKDLQWGFYAGTWGSTPDLTYDYSGETDNWTLTFDTDFPLQKLGVANANPVPIPTAVLLLGSGLVGLAGFRRRTKT